MLCSCAMFDRVLGALCIISPLILITTLWDVYGYYSCYINDKTETQGCFVIMRPRYHSLSVELGFTSLGPEAMLLACKHSILNRWVSELRDRSIELFIPLKTYCSSIFLGIWNKVQMKQFPSFMYLICVRVCALAHNCAYDNQQMNTYSIRWW